MDMQIDSKRVRAERERRAWSQEHLAEVSSLAMRTIQRVEASGNGSYETVKALAAVFECDVDALRAKAAPAQVPVSTEPSRAHRYLAAAAAAILIATVGFFSTTAHAGQVLLDVALSVNEKEAGKHQLITAEGKDAEIRLEGQMRLIVTPSVTADGNVALSIQVFEADGENFTLVSEPKLIAYDNQAAALNLTSKKGSVFKIAITPHKLKT
jgi:transcriptional regulator with XRE-family HTH domain